MAEKAVEGGSTGGRERGRRRRSAGWLRVARIGLATHTLAKLAGASCLTRKLPCRRHFARQPSGAETLQYQCAADDLWRGGGGGALLAEGGAGRGGLGAKGKRNSKQPKPAIVLCFSGGGPPDGSCLVVLGGPWSKLFGGRGSQ